MLDLSLAIRGVPLERYRRYLEGVDKVVEAALWAVIKRRIEALKAAIRKEIIAAGLGERMANTVRSNLFRSRSGDPGAAVFSKAIYRRKGGLVDLITSFQSAITITGGGKFLAIPLSGRKSGADNRRRASPADFPAGAFDLVPLKRRGNYLLVEKASGDAFFLLVPRVTIGKRLTDFAAQHARATRGIEQDFAKECERRLVRLQQRLAA